MGETYSRDKIFLNLSVSEPFSDYFEGDCCEGAAAVATIVEIIMLIKS